mgnify:CR=1 FL=1
MGSAVTFEITGQAGSANAASARTARMPAAALAISGVWNAPETVSGITFAPPATATRLAASTAAAARGRARASGSSAPS